GEDEERGDDAQRRLVVLLDEEAIEQPPQRGTARGAERVHRCDVVAVHAHRVEVARPRAGGRHRAAEGGTDRDHADQRGEDAVAPKNQTLGKNAQSAPAMAAVAKRIRSSRASMKTAGKTSMPAMRLMACSERKSSCSRRRTSLPRAM